jgi:hypothetical protein
MKIISDAEGLILTSTINIQAQKLHQLGQIVFNYRSDLNEQKYYECIKEMQSTCNNIKEKTIELQNKIEAEVRQ